MKPTHHIGNVYCFGKVNASTFGKCEFDRPIKKIHVGLNDDLMITKPNGIRTVGLEAGQEYEFPSLYGYPKDIYITAFADSGEAEIRFFVEEFGEVENPNYWEDVTNG